MSVVGKARRVLVLCAGLVLASLIAPAVGAAAPAEGSISGVVRDEAGVSGFSMSGCTCTTRRRWAART